MPISKKLLKELCDAGCKESYLSNFERIIKAIKYNFLTVIEVEPHANQQTIITLVRFLSSQLKRNVWPIECDKNTTEFDLIGKRIPYLEINKGSKNIKRPFFFGPLLYYYINGGVVLLDGFLDIARNRLREELLKFLNMPNQYFCETTGKTYKKHPNFGIVLIESSIDSRWGLNESFNRSIECFAVQSFKINRLFDLYSYITRILP